MRILIHDYAGHPFQVQLSRELARRGHHVIHAFAGNLLTPRGALHRRAEDPDGFEVIEVPMDSAYRENKYSFLKRRGYEVAYGKELARCASEIKPDVILSANTPSEPQWLLMRAAARSRIPVVIWVQDIYSEAVGRLAREKLPVLGSAVGIYYRWLDRRCFQEGAATVAISEDFTGILRKFGADPERIHIVPNWAPLEELPMQPKANAWASRHGLDGKFAFLYSGTLAMKHNPGLLREIAVDFRRDDGVRVVVISEGPGADYLRKAKGEERLSNLILLPYQDFSEMPEVLASADVLVAVLERGAGVFSVPSKVLTYHAAGRAILGAMPKENLAARIIRQQGSGTCVEPDDVRGFVAAARQLHSVAAQRFAAAKSARDYAEANFDICKIGNRFGEILRSAVAAGNRR